MMTISRRTLMQMMGAGAGALGTPFGKNSEAFAARGKEMNASIVRVHQHGACLARNKRQAMGRSRGGLTSKIHGGLFSPPEITLHSNHIVWRDLIVPAAISASAQGDVEVTGWSRCRRRKRDGGGVVFRPSPTSHSHRPRHSAGLGRVQYAGAVP
jgi:hypothetical protein